jgi:hypothetical protein
MFVNSQGPIPAIGFAFPDVLITPALGIPIPFPNVSMSPTAIPTAPTVLLMCMPAHNLLTIRPVTITGVGVGVLDGTDFGPGHDIMGSTNVFLCGPPANKMTMPTNQNLINAFGLNISPSQIVMIALA